MAHRRYPSFSYCFWAWIFAQRKLFSYAMNFSTIVELMDVQIFRSWHKDIKLLLWYRFVSWYVEALLLILFDTDDLWCWFAYNFNVQTSVWNNQIQWYFSLSVTEFIVCSSIVYLRGSSVHAIYLRGSCLCPKVLGTCRLVASTLVNIY